MTDATNPIRCIVARGFKHLDPGCGRNVLLGPGQEIDLSPEDFARLKAMGAVLLQEEVVQAQVDDAAARLELLRAHFRREPTPVERENYERVPVDKLAELLNAQKQSQAEWEAAKEQRLRDKLARDEAQAEADALRHQKAADRARKRKGA